jgi:hypothetical protein
MSTYVVAIRRRSHQYVPVTIDTTRAQCTSPARVSGSIGGWGRVCYRGIGERSVRRAAGSCDAAYRTLGELLEDYPNAERRRDLDLDREAS